MNKKQKNELKYLNELTTSVNALYCVSFKIISLQRILRPYFKFTIASNEVFFIKSKLSNRSFRVELQSGDYIYVTDKWKRFQYLFYSPTVKDFLQKLIKHKLY